MAEDDCDLEALTAMLDDDDDDFGNDGINPDSGHQKKSEKPDEDECDLETLTSFLEEDDNNEEESQQTTEKGKDSSKNGELSQDDIAAFLNESDSDSDDQTESKKNNDNVPTKKVNSERKTSNKSDSEIQDNVPTKKVNSERKTSNKSDSEIQDELAEMQKKMKELQEQLKASKKAPKKDESDVNLFFGENKVDIHQKKRTSEERRVSGGKTVPTNKQVPVSTNKEITNKQTTNKEMVRSIFGDNDSDSDWDDLDGDRNGLSKEGKEIKKIITSGERNRVAHEPFSTFTTDSYQSTETWKSKSSLPSSLKSPPQQTLSNKTNTPSKNIKTSVNGGNKPATKPEEEKFIMEKNSGIRVIKPLISSAVIELKMDGRKFMKVSTLHTKVKTPEIQGNWVTFGVVVHKTDPKTATSGKTFSIWKLNDLDDCDKTVSFFLFGQVYKEHWKNAAGTVIGLLNPNMMDPADKSPSEVAFTIKHPNQLLIMGQSKDLGWCMGRTKSGNKCTNFVNTKFGGYCAFHVQSAYKKASSKRSEFQGSMTGMTPKSFEKKIMPKGSHYIYGGQTFSSMESKANNLKKKDDKVTVSKLLSQENGRKQKVTTLSIHDIDHDKVKQIVKPVVTAKEQPFIELIATPSVGSMNLVKHLVKSEIKEEEAKSEKPIISITPLELLKQHSKALNEKKRARLAALGQTVPPLDPLSATPTLGKGFYPGQEVCLGGRLSKPQITAVDKSKLLAISKIQKKGGCKKENPNAVKNKSPIQERVKKRVLENLESNGDINEEPPTKRSRLLGNVDLKSPEVQKLMKAKSSHIGAYREAECEREEKYFDKLEKKETMEEKMKSITSLDCYIFTCKQCGYSAMSVGDRCKKERHEITKVKGKKRFFECKKCKQRTIDFNKLPSQPCRNCGEYNFERTCMFKEKAGPKLDSEKLCLRGDEIKNLNSLNEKVFL